MRKLLIALVAVMVILLSTPTASSSVQPQWAGVAGYANHICYHHGGVKQLMVVTGSTSVVCMNNWAYQLAN